MERHELAILGGDVVLPGGRVEQIDVGVRDGRVATLTDNPLDADETIDARGLTVMPGVVDEHFHVFRGYPWETYESGTRAAAKGGVTTVVDMPLDDPPTLTAERLRDKLADMAEACHVDYACFGGYLADDPDEMTAMADAGVTAFKLFTGGVAPPGMYPGVDDGQMLDAFRRAASLGRTVTVHCESAAIVDWETARLTAAGRGDLTAWDEARAWYSEVAAVQTVALLAQVTGARVVIAHVSSPQSVEAIAAARRRGADVWAETCHHYICITGEDALQDDRLKWNPPTRSAPLVAELWEQVRTGLVHSVGSDHAPLPKERGADVWHQAPGPGNNVETMLPVFATKALEHGLPIGQVADLLATTPARLFGLQGRKGSIRVGADADFAIVETRGDRTLDPQDLEYLDAEGKWSPFDGMTLRVYPVYTVLRGRTVFAEGTVTGAPGDGEHVAAADGVERV